MENKDIKCSSCPHTIHKLRRFGESTHCTASLDLMDVSHLVVCNEKCASCPLDRGDKNE